MSNERIKELEATLKELRERYRLSPWITNQIDAVLNKQPKLIEWTGGDCPVGINQLVEVVFRNGCYTQGQAICFYWSHLNAETDIVKYGVIE